MVMKKYIILSLAAVTLLSGCSSYTGAGAFSGATLGSVIGSAIGGIAGGPRGSDIGTLVGMAGGAVVGGAMGAQSDKQEQERRAYSDTRFEEKYREHRAAATRGNGYDGQDYGYGYEDESGFDPTGGGDDVLYDFQGSDYTGDYTATHPTDVTPSVRYDDIHAPYKPSAQPLEVRNARFVDDNQDRRLNGGELSKVIFEVYNTSREPVYDVQPMVVETTGSKHITISNTIHVERILPGKGVRYTAMVKAGKRLKDGRLTFRVYAVRGNHDVVSNVSEFSIEASRK